MMETILHIGMHKTGTSSIQQALYSSSFLKNCYYISIGGANQSGLVASAFHNKAERHPSYSRKGFTYSEFSRMKLQARQNLTNEFQKAGERAAILSAERLCLFDQSELDDLFQFINSVRPRSKIRIIAYVRSPKSYMESAFQQRLKDRYSAFRIAAFWPNYREKFQKFDKTFGIDNVELIKFEKINSIGGDVVMDFMHRIDCQLNDLQTVRANESLSLAACKLLYLHNCMYRNFSSMSSFPSEQGFFVDALTKLGGGRFHLHSKIVQSVFDKNIDDLAWIEKRMECSLLEDMFAHDGVAICSEQDLLTVDDQIHYWMLDWLRQTSSRVFRLQGGSHGNFSVDEVLHAFHVRASYLGYSSRSSISINADKVNHDENIFVKKIDMLEIVADLAECQFDLRSYVPLKSMSAIVAASFQLLNADLVGNLFLERGIDCDCHG